MLEALKPETVIFYGAIPDGLEEADQVIKITAFQDKLKKYNKPRAGIDERTAN